MGIPIYLNMSKVENLDKTLINFVWVIQMCSLDHIYPI